MAALTVKKVTDPKGGTGFPFKLSRVTKWGSGGTGNGQFKAASGIAVDGAGNVYVADYTSDRIQKFDGNGNYLTQWGAHGQGDGQFYWPTGVAADGAGNIYVADCYNQRIQKFDGNGNFLAKWGSAGKWPGQLDNPSGVAVDAAGNVYVADTLCNRIQKFDSTGQYVAEWGTYGNRRNMPDLSFPSNVAVDSAGNNYVVDKDNQRIQRFDANGNYLGEWRRDSRDFSPFDSSTGIAVDGAGFVYVADGNRNRIDKFDANGNHLDRWGLKGHGFGNGFPFGVAVDGFGNVFVAEMPLQRVVKFSQDENFVLSDDQSITFNGVAAGTYYVGETTIDRWVLYETNCAGRGSGGSPDVWSGGLEITMANDDVACTFINRDTIAPTVRISTGLRATNSSPINFTIAFSEPVTGFATGAVTLGGTAGATTAEVTEVAPNDGTTYNVAVSGMTATGTVSVTIDAGVVRDAAGNLNEASSALVANSVDFVL